MDSGKRFCHVDQSPFQTGWRAIVQLDPVCILKTHEMGQGIFQLQEKPVIERCRILKREMIDVEYPSLSFRFHVGPADHFIPV